RDENLLDLETDKVVLEVPAPADGVLKEILFKEGDTVEANQLLARIEEGAGAAKEEKAAAPKEEKAAPKETKEEPKVEKPSAGGEQATGPSVRRMLAEHDLQSTQISGSGKDGRITKDDVISFIETNREKPTKPAAKQEQPALGPREERRVPMSRLR